MDDRLVITLLRHGMTDENERSAYIGWTDSPLNKKGREMVRALSSHVMSPGVIFSSSAARCLETAGILFPRQTVMALTELKEMHFGDWEGKTYEDLRQLKTYQAWLDAPFSKGPDSGESFDQFAARVQTGWDFIKAHIEAVQVNSAAVITHGGVIRFLLSKVAPESKAFFEWHVPLASGYELVWTKEGFRRGDTCISLQEVPLTERPSG